MNKSPHTYIQKIQHNDQRKASFYLPLDDITSIHVIFYSSSNQDFYLRYLSHFPIFQVANQMISATRAPRGFTVASPEEDATAPDPAHYNLMARRGSKSLPVSPAHSPPGSPNSRRRRNGNR